MPTVYADEAMWRRGWVIALVGPIYTAIMMAVATVVVYSVVSPIDGVREGLETVLDPGDWDLLDQAWLWYCGFPAVLFVITQLLFLWPVGSEAIRAQPRGRPLWMMIIGAGGTAATLCLAFAFTIAAAVQLLWATVALDDPENFPWPDASESTLFLLGLGFLATSWATWTLVLFRFASRRPVHMLPDRLLGLLLAGTIIESALLLPIDIMIRRRTDCYCGTASFPAMCLSIWALLWLCGPGAILVFTKRRRRAWAETHCGRCGYLRGPSPGERCPECGEIWQARSRATPQAADG